jgi:hypothetical protein
MKSMTFFSRHFELLLTIIIFAACEKPGVVISPVAIVPKTVYSGDRNIPINASYTGGAGVNSKVSFLWSWASVPPGADQPQFENPRASMTYIQRMPVPGMYLLRLQVSEQSRSATTTEYRIEVLPDTLGKYPAKANAGEDMSIYWPQNAVFLEGCGSALLNPPGRPLFFKWTQLAAPLGAITTQIQQPADCETGVIGLNVEGEYVFTLSVTNEAGSIALDTVVVTVYPDTMKGKSLEYTGVWADGIKSWNSAAVADVGLAISSSLFAGRRQNMEVQVWDEQQQRWHDPGLYPWEILVDEWWGDYTYYLVIFPVPNPNPSTYYSLVGREAKVKVIFK